MTKNLDTSSLNISEFEKNIINQIDLSKSYIITYKPRGVHVNKEDLSEVMKKESYEIIKKQIKQKNNHSFVYLIIVGDEVKYVGKAIDIKTRIKNHLYKKNEKTNSKISKIYEILSIDDETQIKCYILQIESKKLYSLIEGLLIKHYDTVNIGWNEKEN